METTEPEVPGPADTPPEMLTYRCMACGSTTQYAPGTHQLKCPSCGSTRDVAGGDGSVDEHSFDAWAGAAVRGLAGAPVQEHTYSCESCGATTTTTDLAQRCPFCGGAVASSATPQGRIEPEAVVPFALTQVQAADKFRGWVTSRWFAPNALKRVAGLAGGVQGVYVPHWTFDADTTTHYTGQRGEHRTRQVSDGKGGTRTETYTDWYPASGVVGRAFDDVCVPASSAVVPDKLAEAGPWDLAQAAAFTPDYLAGYSAAGYDVEPSAGLEQAKQVMADVITDDCESDIGGDQQRVHSMDTTYAEVMFKLLLLPLWIAAYTYRGRTFQVVVNASTGEVTGERPYSPVKITLAVLAALITVAVIVVLVRNR